MYVLTFRDNIVGECLSPEDQRWRIQSLHHKLRDDAHSKGTFNVYPHSRLKISDALLDDVKLLKSRGTSTAGIYEHIIQNSDSRPLKYDLHNLLAKLKREAANGSTVTSRMKDWVRGFAFERPGNVACVMRARSMNEYDTEMESWFLIVLFS